MPRVISSNLSTQLSQTVTEVGYLMHIELTSPLYWSNIGAVQYPTGGQQWTSKEFQVSGLSFDVDSELSATIDIENLDGAAAQIFMGSDRLYDTLVSIYQFDRGALASGDAPKIAKMSISSARINAKNVILNLVENTASSQFTPKRRINPVDGFYYALPPGAKLTWGNETLILEDSNNG